MLFNVLFQFNRQKFTNCSIARNKKNLQRCRTFLELAERNNCRKQETMSSITSKCRLARQNPNRIKAIHPLTSIRVHLEKELLLSRIVKRVRARTLYTAQGKSDCSRTVSTVNSCFCFGTSRNRLIVLSLYAGFRMSILFYLLFHLLLRLFLSNTAKTNGRVVAPLLKSNKQFVADYLRR